MSRVRKLLFTRRKSNQNGVLVPFIQPGADFARAWQSGVVLVMCARKRDLWPPSIQFIFGVRGIVGCLIHTPSESELAPTLSRISWATTKYLAPNTL